MSAMAKLLVNHAPGFTLRLSNRKLLNGLCGVLGIADPTLVFRTLDKLDKQGAEAVTALLKNECGLSDQQVAKTFRYLECPVTPTDFSKLREYFGDVQVGHDGIKEVEAVVAGVREQGFIEHLAIDLSIARGLDYYTGSIYETSLNGLDGFGSVMSGGRYDTLLDMFTGHATPAIGISIGLDRLLAGLMELKLIDGRGSPTQVLVTVFNSDLRATATKTAAIIRAAGVPTELFLADDKLGKQFRYADRKQIPYTVVCGPDEAAQGVVKIKTMASGDEQTFDAAALAEWAKGLKR
jgi:histidyl-tRNA synthetase